MKRGAICSVLACAAILLVAAPVRPQTPPAAPVVSLEPPPHTGPWPDLRSGQTEGIRDASLSLGPEMQRGRPARIMLAERRRLDSALAALKPQRAGTVDAYVVSVALDSDPVFAREAREAGRVLARRYDSAGRSVVLAGPDGRNADLPGGSITTLTLTLARLAEVMDPAEDVLVLYSTSHGAPHGLAYHEGEVGYGILSPQRLADVLAELGIARRIVMLSACYSGVFVPPLASADTAILTAAAADKPSFGCQSHNDWTFFGDALVNRALRKRQVLTAAAREAQATIAAWESARKLDPSQPQVSIGSGVARWLPVLEARAPREETQPVGRPATGE
jgi:Peptidase C13 family